MISTFVFLLSCTSFASRIPSITSSKMSTSLSLRLDWFFDDKKVLSLTNNLLLLCRARQVSHSERHGISFKQLSVIENNFQEEPSFFIIFNYLFNSVASGGLKWCEPRTEIRGSCGFVILGFLNLRKAYTSTKEFMMRMGWYKLSWIDLYRTL